MRWVYYALTPLLIWVYNRRIVLDNLLTGLACFVGLWFSSYVLTADKTLAEQWVHYVNPFNNLYLYCAGLAIYYNTHRINFSARASIACCLVATALFFMYPASGNQINIVTDTARVIFSLASVLMVIGFYKNTLHIPCILAAPLTPLGVITYAVYLLHPVVYRVLMVVIRKSHLQADSYIVIGLTMALTIVVALLSFKVLEKPLITLGKKLTSRSDPRERPILKEGTAL